MMHAATWTHYELALPRQSQPLRLVVLSTWLLALVSFSLPGRVAPESASSLDMLALAKVAARLGVLFVLTATLWMTHDTKRRSAALARLLPLFLFVAWAVLSTAWSPLKAVSLGQAAGLAALAVYAAATATWVRSEEDVCTLLKHLCLVLLVASGGVLLVHLVSPDASGLNRNLFLEGADGVVHPTAAGATAALGVLLAASIATLWRWPWAKTLLWPCMSVHGAILYLAASRTALGLTIALLPLAVWSYLGRFGRAVMLSAVFLSIMAAALYLLVDPQLHLASDSFDSVAAYTKRGQTGEDLAQFSGRAEMWDAVWREFRKSMLIGHGYFVTSQRGELEVWYKSANHTAHNIVLQVLVSTGLVGGVLFLWAVARPIGGFLLGTGDSRAARRIKLLVVPVLLWYAGWSQLGISFLGPIRPESATFFLLLGLGVAAALGVQEDQEHSPEVAA